MSDIYDLIVIGGGSAGLVAAGGAGIIGANVALVEKSRLGGDCLYTGCVPSKTLIRSARLASDMRNAEAFGFERAEPAFRSGSFSSVTRHVQDVIGMIEEHDAPEVFEEMGAEVIFGSPRFLNGREIEVTLNDSGEKRVMRAKRFCISTGSSPFVPPIDGLAETGYITNEDIFELKDLPERFVVIGGGAIGIELGQSFARFGSKVTVIEMFDRILAKEDRKVSEFMTDVLTAEGVDVRTSAKATKFAEHSDGSRVVTIETNGSTEEIVCDEILVAVGRKPNLDGLELKQAGVEFDQKHIRTDAYLRTSAKHIYAAGDVTGNFQFTHMADYEAQIVLNNAFLFWPLRKKADYSVVPWATFSEPEVARVGMIEEEARNQYGDSLTIYEVPFSHNDRALAEGSGEGFAKLVLKDSKILGVTIVGPHAGELIHEFVLAMRHGLSLKKLNEAIHVYPTLGKITQALATEMTIEGFKKPFLQKWLRRYLRLLR
ncbi:MAG: FAD-dependent oxidoreductase [Pyrinomonadaceae bacterium]|nr:FAD-dependent oxidoreductase [Pyrinomonadaceae bacterium]